MKASGMPSKIVAAVLLLVVLGAGCATAPIQFKDVVPPEAVPVVQVKTEKPVVALALGSGGSRGFAHVGVIKALEANGIFPDIVVGTSAGSVVGAFYAGGYTGDELVEMANRLEREQISDYIFPDRGIIRGELLQDFINKALNNRSIEDLGKPFAAIATELKTGKITVFNRGNTGMAVRASSSIPGIFQPVAINGSEYVDGDLKSPVPVKVARSMGADLVIAVDISRQPDSASPDSILSMLRQSLKIIRQSIIEWETQSAEVVIRPEIGPTAVMDFNGKKSLMEEGEKAALAALPQIRQWLEKIATEKAQRAGKGGAALPFR